MSTYSMRRQTTRGSATVEFAIIFPLFVLLLVGLLEFGLAIWCQEMMTNATREAARAGIVSGNPSLTQDQIQEVLESHLRLAGIDPDATVITITGVGGSSGDPLTVAVVYPYQFMVLHQLTSSLGTSIDLTAQTVMFLE